MIKKSPILSGEEQFRQDLDSLKSIVDDLDMAVARGNANLWDAIDEIKARLVCLEEIQSNQIKIRKLRFLRKCAAKRLSAS